MIYKKNNASISLEIEKVIFLFIYLLFNSILLYVAL